MQMDNDNISKVDLDSLLGEWGGMARQQRTLNSLQTDVRGKTDTWTKSDESSLQAAKMHIKTDRMSD
jgi:hypothetical protein